MPRFPRIRGRHGEITIPGLGAVVGRFDGEGGWWELHRREEPQKSGELAVYRLRAVLSYINPTLWGNEGMKKRLVLKIGESLFRVDVVEGQRMELNGRTLQSEGVTLCQVEGQ